MCLQVWAATIWRAAAQFRPPTPCKPSKVTAIMPMCLHVWSFRRHVFFPKGPEVPEPL